MTTTHLSSKNSCVGGQARREKMDTAVSDRREKESTKIRIGKQHTAEGFTTKASMKNVTVIISKYVYSK